MTRERVEAILGQGYRHHHRKQTYVYGPFGRLGQTYRITYSGDRVTDVEYFLNPGDK